VGVGCLIKTGARQRTTCTGHSSKSLARRGSSPRHRLTASVRTPRRPGSPPNITSPRTGRTGLAGDSIKPLRLPQQHSYSWFMDNHGSRCAAPLIQQRASLAAGFSWISRLIHENDRGDSTITVVRRSVVIIILAAAVLLVNQYEVTGRSVIASLAGGMRERFGVSGMSLGAGWCRHAGARVCGGAEKSVAVGSC
jgi:hypothetical protein